ncbi:hypothetical protein CHK_2418 [Christensenella hongkongensis]|uniref:Uncharacterized protein n=1 Tax=Christensenella hongkongensis TaxID=270498 RepID=A0A0M2NJA5_9FIRM|nr:hypothetical protein CHK_2418 [Christensenella hongkongensis]
MRRKAEIEPIRILTPAAVREFFFYAVFALTLQYARIPEPQVVPGRPANAID